MLPNFMGNFVIHMFHILIHTTIFINFYLYYSDSQTPTGKAEKNEVEARR